MLAVSYHSPVFHVLWHFQEAMFHDLPRHRGEADRLIVLGVLLSTLSKNGCGVSLFVVTRDLNWLPWLLKCHAEWLGKYGVWFPLQLVVKRLKLERTVILTAVSLLYDWVSGIKGTYLPTDYRQSCECISDPACLKLCKFHLYAWKSRVKTAQKGRLLLLTAVLLKLEMSSLCGGSHIQKKTEN